MVRQLSPCLTSPCSRRAAGRPRQSPGSDGPRPAAEGQLVRRLDHVLGPGQLRCRQRASAQAWASHAATMTMLILLGATLSGCMTVVNQMGYWSDSSVGHMTDPEAVVYGGTRADVTALWNAITSSGPAAETAGDITSRIGFGFLFLIDTPLCLIADTLLLPLTLSEAWWLHAHRTADGSHDT